MRVAFFVTMFPTLSETFIANQIIAIQNSGHQVTIFSKERPAGDKVHQMIADAGLLEKTFYLCDLPKTRVAKIRLLIAQLLKNISAENIRIVLRAAFKRGSSPSVYELIPFLDKSEFNILHAHFGPNGVYVAELKKLGLFKRSKFITTFHGYDLHPNYRKNNNYEYLFVCCDRFTVNTKYSLELLKKLGCIKKKIDILPVGLNVTYFTRQSPYDENKKQLQLLFVGRLIELKGPMIFLEICKQLQQRNRIDFIAVMIGEGPLFSKLRDQIDSEGLTNKVSLPGAKTQEETKGYLDESDIFILPGIEFNRLAEAQGLVIQEAQAMKIPVLVSDAGGMAEGVLEGITGYVLPQRDVDAFVDKIEYFATNPSIRKQMGSAGRKFVEANYDIKILEEKLLKVYN